MKSRFFKCPLCDCRSILIYTDSGEVLIEKDAPVGNKKIIVIDPGARCVCCNCEAEGNLIAFSR
jgi:hypothetical protein